MAQGLVTYLGGAVRPSNWLEAAGNPTLAYHWFEDGHSNGAGIPSGLSADTSANAGRYGRINTSPGSNSAQSTTSLHVICNAPSKFAFEAKGAFAGNGQTGALGIAEVAVNTQIAIANDEGAYFYVDSSDGLVFRVRTGTGANDHQTRVITYSGAITAERRYGFTFEGGLFRVFIDGAEVAEIRSTFPPGDMRFIAGKRNAATATTNQLASLDYFLISVPRE